MLRFISKRIFVGLAREAVLGYIQQGKQVPQTLDGVEEVLSTVMSKKEIELYGRIAWVDEATQEVVQWMLGAEPMRSWFAGCEMGKELIEAQEKQENTLLPLAQSMLAEHEALEAEHRARDSEFRALRRG